MKHCAFGLNFFLLNLFLILMTDNRSESTSYQSLSHLHVDGGELSGIDNWESRG